MAELKENQLVFTDDQGNEVLCDIIFTYDSEEFKKSYVFFAPAGGEDEDGKVEVSCASYIPTDGGIGELMQVETDEEWDMLSEVFDDFASADDDEECECGCDFENGCYCEECSESDCHEECDCHHEHKEHKDKK